MSAHRLVNIALVVLIIAIYALMAHLDGPSDHSTEMAQAQDLQAAIKNEAAQARFARAASTICGENAGWYLVDDSKTIQCTTKRGHKTKKAVL